MSRFLRKKRDKTYNFNYIKCKIGFIGPTLHIVYKKSLDPVPTFGGHITSKIKAFLSVRT